MQDPHSLRSLFEKWYAGTASATEVEVLHSLLNDKENLEAIRGYSREKWDEMLARDIDWSAVPATMVDDILARSGNKEEESTVTPVHRVQLLKTAWLRYAAIALLMVGAGVYFWLAGKKEEELAHKPAVSATHIQAGGNRAILTLADGSTIILDSAADGTLAAQGNTKIIKLNEGALAYNSGALPPDGKVPYNTISTPKGGQYQIVLPDGSRVWLNAASSIRFPVSFAGNERQVEVDGEVYFEVKKDAVRPFSVTANQSRIDVLGTSFNVNAYSNEDTLRTTLVEGSVRVNAGSRSGILSPGEQAQVNAAGKKPDMQIISNVDIDKVLAWKNGYFNFENASLEMAMKQLERWYNIEVVYEKDIPPVYFVGKLSMKWDLDKLLKILEESSGVHFKIEDGRKLKVMP